MLCVAIRVSLIPLLTRYRLTCAARRWPSARLYSAVPRSSVWPVTTSVTAGFAASVLVVVEVDLLGEGLQSLHARAFSVGARVAQRGQRIGATTRRISSGNGIGTPLRGRHVHRRRGRGGSRFGLGLAAVTRVERGHCESGHQCKNKSTTCHAGLHGARGLR